MRLLRVGAVARMAAAIRAAVGRMVADTPAAVARTGLARFIGAADRTARARVAADTPGAAGCMVAHFTAAARAA